MKKLYTFSFIIIILSNIVFAQVDTEFWFAVPEIDWQHHSVSGEPTYVWVSSLDNDVVVTLTMPARGDTVLGQKTVLKGTSVFFNLTHLIRIGVSENDPATDAFSGTENNANTLESGLAQDLTIPFAGLQGVVDNRGIRIVSTPVNPLNTDYNITAYLDRFNPNNKDILALKGENGLGSSFHIPSQNIWDNRSYGQNAFDIIATKNGTKITITPKQALMNTAPPGTPYAAGVPFTITLNRGETFSCVAASIFASGHLGGSTVVCDDDEHPIAIMWSDDSVDSKKNDGANITGGGVDLIGDQIVPDELLGQDYIVMRGELTMPEYVFVMATQDDTDVEYYDAADMLQTINLALEGDIKKIQLNTVGNIINALSIHAYKPLSVFHITGIGVEFGGAIIPTIDLCTGSKDVSVVRSDNVSYFINIMTKKKDIGGFTMKFSGGTYLLPSAWFTPAVATQITDEDWYYLDKAYNDFDAAHTVGQGLAIPSVPQGIPVQITNPGRFHLGTIDGRSSGCNYGYFSSFSSDGGSVSIAGTNDIGNRYCWGDTIKLEASGALSYTWRWGGIASQNTFLTATNVAKPMAVLKPNNGSIQDYYYVEIVKDCYNPLIENQIEELGVKVTVYEKVEVQVDTMQLSPNCCSPAKYKLDNQPQVYTNYSWTIPTESGDTIFWNQNYYLDNLIFENKTNAALFYDVEVTAAKTGNALCNDTKTYAIQVKPEIIAKSALTSKSGCNEVIIDTFNIVGASGPFTRIHWEWGDGQAEDYFGPFDIANDIFIHTYNNFTDNDTTYIAQATFYDAINNCVDTAPPHSTLVVGVARASFTVSDSDGCSPHTVDFLNTKSGSVPYIWDFDNGTVSTTAIDTTITFSNTGTSPKNYDIYMQVTREGCTHDTVKTITVYPEFATTISPAALQEGCNPLSVDFSQTTIPNVPNLQFEWDFGNGSTSGDSDPALKEFKHTLASDQNYQVTLETTSEYNCKATATPVEVLVYAFVDSKFTVSDTVGCSPLTVEVNNNSHINSVSNFVWDIDAGAGIPINNAPFDVVFENKTASNITQTISLGNNNPPHNCPVSFNKEITIYPEINANFNKNRYDTLCNNESVNFTNSSFYTNIADVISGSTPTYLWDFGDGTTSSVENPVKSYKNTSTTLKKFYVKLTLSLNGCESIYLDSVTVYAEVKAQLNTADVNVCAPNDITLNNTSVGGTSYLWEFGDGTPDIIRTDNSSVTYSVDNLNANSVIQSKVYLTASSASCSHTDSLTINVFPHIVPHIESDLVSGCGPLNVTFVNQTTGGDATNPLTYAWDFDDGETSNVINPPLHTFGNRGGADKSYTVNLTATNSAGCVSSHDTLITVFSEIEAIFSFNKNTECTPMPVFMDNNSLNGTRFQWDFGFDGNTIDTVSGGDFYYEFYHTHTNPNAIDIYTIKLKVIDESHPQCSDSVSYPIHVYPPVVANFAITDSDEGCSPLESEFTNSSTGYKLTYVWDYRDSNTSGNSQNIHTHIFENLSEANKLYDVKLTASDTNGCTATTYQTVTAYPKVVADFTFTKDLDDRCTPYPVYFAYPETALNGNKFSWDYGFDGESDLFNEKLSFDFEFDNELPNTIENYTIQLISSDTITGCTDTAVRTIEVYPRLVPNYSSVSGDYAGCNPLTLEFDNESTGLADYLWDFNDEQTSPDESPQHIFTHRESANREFEVLLTATQTATGCIRDVSRMVTVYSYLNPKFGLKQALPAGKGDVILGGCSPFNVQVTDSSTCNGTWYWDFGSDDIENVEDLVSPPLRGLTYTNVDEDGNMDNEKYSILLTVENPEGCTKQTTQSLEVYPRSLPNFNVDLQGCHPLRVDFENSTVDDGNSQYYWLLGDGATAVAAELEHTYYNSSYFDEKTFDVWLYCTTLNLCSDSISQQITVYPKPLAAISPELDRGCSPLTAALVNASKGSKPTFNWDFDNGETKETNDVTNEYPAYINNTNTVQIKYVELVVESEQGCTDTVIQLINVYPEATANFGYYDPSDTSGCSPHEVEFLNLSNATSTVYHWDFGNETTSQLRNPTYRFINDGDNDRVFTVTLNVESPYGCKSTYQDDITVYLSPNAEFLALDPIKQYPDTIIEFVSLVKPGPWTYDWDYGDGHFSNTSEEFHKHVYDGWGPREEDFSYTVWLKAYSEHCVDSVWQFVTINPPEPYINIVQRNPLGCVPLEVDFNITYAFGYEDSIRWNFGNGVTSKERDPYYVYEESGVYISLVTISGDGGTFIDTTKIYVYPLPEPSFEFRPDFVMLPDQPVQFFNTTYLVDKSNYYWEFGDGTSSNEIVPWHQYTRQGVYDIKLVATTFYGCKDSIMSRAPVTVSGEGYIQFPNAFLPTSSSSSDGSYPVPDTENDVFHPINKGVKDYELWIFNRWGEQLFYSDNILVGWNGRYGNNGDELGQDVYFWKTKGKFNNDVPFKEAGDVTLIRR